MDTEHAPPVDGRPEIEPLERSLMEVGLVFPAGFSRPFRSAGTGRPTKAFQRRPSKTMRN